MTSEFNALLASVGITSTEGLNVPVLENRLKDLTSEIVFVSQCCESPKSKAFGELGFCSKCRDKAVFVPVIDGELIIH